MRVMVTGAGGMLGQDVVRAARHVDHEVTALDRSALDITDRDAVRAAVAAGKPSAIVNCAAYTDVDGAQRDVEGAERLNGEAAGILAEAAAEAGAAIVYPSTDYVFDGRGTRPYVESDPVAPASAYGSSKLSGERVTAAANPDHWIVRTAWLFGLGGRNFVDTMLSLAASVPSVKVVRDQAGSPTFTGHLATGIVALLEGRDFGVHHIAATGHCSWYDFAVEIFRQTEVDCAVLPITTADFPRPAPRPEFSVLASERERPVSLPDWQAGLAAYLGERSR